MLEKLQVEATSSRAHLDSLRWEGSQTMYGSSYWDEDMAGTVWRHAESHGNDVTIQRYAEE